MMGIPRKNLATTLILLTGLLVSAGAPSYAAGAKVRGTVTDESKGVLPGVTVVAMAPDGRVLTTAVTDGQGGYVIGPLAPGRVVIVFQLQGFASAGVRVTVGAETDADAVVNQRLLVAPQSETVEVVGKLPEPPPPPPPPPLPKPKPRPVTVAVPEHDRDAVCSPAKLGAKPESFGTVQTHRSATNGLFAQGDELIIETGGEGGRPEVGRNFVVRRTFRIDWEPGTEIGEHTAGLVQIVSAAAQSAVAVVIYACDEILPGDRLASFNPEPVRAPALPGTPDYKQAFRILFPDTGQMLGAPRRMMVIDGGSGSGVRVGDRVTLFRRRFSGEGSPSIVGDAVVVAVRTDSATIRVDGVRDAIFSGDMAAPQRR